MSENSPFIDIQWLDVHTRNIGLNRLNVMKYFYTSPFYDNTSNNESIRLLYGYSEQDYQQLLLRLESMVGVQYILDDQNINEPILFVIKKVLRRSPRLIDIVNVYYCHEGTIYQGPNLLGLIHTRIAKGTYYLLKSFEETNKTLSYSDSGHIMWASSQSINRNSSVDHQDHGMYVTREFPSMDSALRDLVAKDFFDDS